MDKFRPDVLLLTRNGRPVATVTNLFHDANIKTRISQIKATENEKGIHIAKTIVLKRLESQNLFLKKHGLRQHDIMRIKETIGHLEETNLKALRRKLLPIEGRCSTSYFSQFLSLFPSLRTTNNRKTYRAFDGLNNNLNLLYTFLKWKVHSSLVKASLEPFCGYVHSEEFGKPSLVCDFQELYRYLIDDFVIQYCQRLAKKDFMFKTEKASGQKKGKREYLNNAETKDFTTWLNDYFETIVEIPRIKVGKTQTIETLTNEEALLFAKFLRNENKDWIPRVKCKSKKIEKFKTNFER